MRCRHRAADHRRTHLLRHCILSSHRAHPPTSIDCRSSEVLLPPSKSDMGVKLTFANWHATCCIPRMQASLSHSRIQHLTSAGFPCVRLRTPIVRYRTFCCRKVCAHVKTVRAELAAETESHNRGGRQRSSRSLRTGCASNGAELCHSVRNKARD